MPFSQEEASERTKSCNWERGEECKQIRVILVILQDDISKRSNNICFQNEGQFSFWLPILSYSWHFLKKWEKIKLQSRRRKRESIKIKIILVILQGDDISKRLKPLFSQRMSVFMTFVFTTYLNFHLGYLF